MMIIFKGKRNGCFSFLWWAIASHLINVSDAPAKYFGFERVTVYRALGINAEKTIKKKKKQQQAKDENYI